MVGWEGDASATEGVVEVGFDGESVSRESFIWYQNRVYCNTNTMHACIRSSLQCNPYLVPIAMFGIGIGIGIGVDMVGLAISDGIVGCIE